MKKKLSLLLVLLLLVSLTACGGSSGSNSGGSANSSAPSHPEEPEAGAGWDGSYNMDSNGPAADEMGSTGSTLPTNTKMIYSADIALETTEFDSAEQALSRIVESLGGWFESRSIYQGGGYRSLRCTVRVPAQSFTAFLDQAGEAAHVTSRDEYAEDVSEVYYDNESRLTTQRTKLERLQLLLSQATVMEDIITLETAISETELEIEYLTGSLRKYDSLVGYSTITLRLQEVYQLSTDEPPAVTFGQRLSGAFTVGLARGINGLEEFCIALARNWFNLIILAAVVVIVVLLLRWRRRKENGQFKRSRPSQPQEPPEPPKPPESKK